MCIYAYTYVYKYIGLSYKQSTCVHIDVYTYIEQIDPYKHICIYEVLYSTFYPVAVLAQVLSPRPRFRFLCGR